MNKDAIVFVDVDESEQPCYYYREPHFSVARQRGLVCLTVAKAQRPFLSRLSTHSDRVILIEELDECSLSRLILELSCEFRISALFCYPGQAGPNGQVGVIVARVCRQLGLHHASPESINACNDKFAMRKRLRESGLNSVPFALCHTREQLIAGATEIGYPLVAKPRFGARSAFIKICSNEQELLEHYQFYQYSYSSALSRDSLGKIECVDGIDNIPGSTILLEGWIGGTEGSVECVVGENIVYPLIINEKLVLTSRTCTILENLLITPPVSFSLSEQKIIRQYASECVKSVGLHTAIAHFEFKMTESGPIVIEINPRLGGLYVSSAFVDIAEINPWELYLDLLMNVGSVEDRLAQAMVEVDNNTDSYSMIALYPDRSGYYKGFSSLHHLENHPQILEFEQLPCPALVDSDAEEHYLLKCWAKVKGKADAVALYQEVLDHASPIVE